MKINQGDGAVLQDGSLADTLATILGEKHVIRDRSENELMSQDIYQKSEFVTDFVVRPPDIASLCSAVAAVTRAGRALAIRGGGMSYTGGYIPARSGMVMFDCSRLDRIVSCCPEDMFVKVEAGCTWAQLDEYLKPRGLRTPFWGPLSGLSSTIGGGLSQNNAFFGAGRYGPASESVLSVDVALANGETISTGSAGGNDARPWFRHYGPDITGLFLGDAGSLGVKTTATLRLINRPEVERYASFNFKDRSTFLRAMSDLARAGLCAEIFGFDPPLQNLRMQRASLMADAKTLGSVMKAGGGLMDGIRSAAAVVKAGRNFVDESCHSLHVTCEGASETIVTDEIDRVRKISQTHSGTEIENSIPKIIRANPFPALNSVIGPKGERWAPVHGIVAHSRAERVWDEIAGLLLRRKGDIEANDISIGTLAATISNHAVLLEPVFFWPGEIFPLHEKTVEASYLKKAGRATPNPSATALVSELRGEIIAIFRSYGAAHFQIGKSYPYASTRTEPVLDLVRSIKMHVDPDNLINPGSLLSS